MNLKKITSLTMLLSMIMMTFTGIILFITPPGRVANWAQWKLFGITKELYADIHSTFMVLFIVATILHVYYNWKPMIGYMKNQARELIVFTGDMIVALGLTLLFLFGTVYDIAPFKTFLDFGDNVKESWEKDYGTAPYPHAELSSLESFCKQMGYDLEKSRSILDKNGIKHDLQKSLSQIAKENGIAPKALYDMLKSGLGKGESKVQPMTGLGKKSINEVARVLGLSTEEFLVRLKAEGIEATGDEKFKEAVERYGKSPMDVMGKMGYHKE